MKHISRAMTNTMVETSRATLAYWLERAKTCSTLMEGESKQFLFNQITCEFESICDTVLNNNILSTVEVDDHRRRFYGLQSS
jgi:hypothetical protein